MAGQNLKCLQPIATITDNSFEIAKEFLMYMDLEGIIKDLKISGLRYKSIIKSFLVDGIFIPPFRFIIKIDLLRIQEISYRLFMFLVKEPEKSLEIARDLTYHALAELTTIQNISNSDIQIVFEVTSFSNVSLVHDVVRVPPEGLTAINGILIGRTTLYKYTRSAVYFCKLTTCSNANGRRYPTPFSSGCHICCCQMEEDIRSVDIGEEITCQMICSTVFSKCGRFQSIRMKIRDEVCSHVNLQIGMEYTAVGIFHGDIFMVWNISYKPARYDILSKMNSLYPVPIPDSIAELYYAVREYCPTSPWSFVGAIAATLGSDIFPASSFLQLKIGLILSLATQNSEDPPVPLVAIGADSSAVQKLMSNAGQLAERFINYSAGYVQLGGDKRHACRDEIWYEAGAIILAATGVCNLGDWSRFRKDQCNCICQVIESGRVMLNNTDKGKTETDFVPLRSVLWTYWCHITSSNQDQLQLKTLINIFGMPFLAEEKNEVEAVKLSRRILERSTLDLGEESTHPTIPLEDLKEFISLINSRQLVLNESASKLIHDFFVIFRKERPECLPLGAIKTITSLAEAHSRLSLRNEIFYEDVMAVLYLYNESISTLFGSPLVATKFCELNETQPVYEFVGIFLGYTERLVRILSWIGSVKDTATHQCPQSRHYENSNLR